MIGYMTFFDTVRRDLDSFRKDFACDLYKEINASENEMKSSIMFYGVYNAGKSTLLNALISENKAAVADKPMTDKVDSYNWQGYEILDTPGIDAPPEHEQTTEEQLLKTDVVLFIVSVDTFENEYIYEKMAVLAIQNKPLLLIVNMKQTLSKEDRLSVFSRISVHLNRIGEKNNLASFYEKPEVKFVNAKSALKGKLESKSVLLKDSGMPELEEQLTIFLGKCTAKTKANTYANRLKELVLNEKKSLQAEILPLDIKNISTLNDITSQTKKIIFENLKNLSQSVPIDYKSELGTCLENGNGVEAVINEIADKFEKAAIKIIDDEQSKLLEMLSMKSVDNDFSVGDGLIKNYAISDEFNHKKELAQSENVSFDFADAISKSLIAFETAPPVIIYGIPVVKILAVGAALFSAFKTNSVSQAELDSFNEEAKEAQIRKMSMINAAIKDIFKDVDVHFSNYIKEVIAQIFTPIENKLQELRVIQEEQNSKLADINQQIEFLDKTISKLEMFITNDFELGSNAI